MRLFLIFYSMKRSALFNVVLHCTDWMGWGIFQGGRRRASRGVDLPYLHTPYPFHTTQMLTRLSSGIWDGGWGQPSCITSALGMLYSSLAALAGGIGSSSLQPGRKRPVWWRSLIFFSLLGWLDSIFINLLESFEPALLTGLLLCCQGLDLLYFLCTWR